MSLPNQEEFDIDINLTVTRKQTNKIKELLKDKTIIARLPIAKHLITSQNQQKADPAVMYAIPFLALSVFQYQRMHMRWLLQIWDKKDFIRTPKTTLC